MGESIEIAAADGHPLTAYRTGNPEAAHALVVCHDVGGLNKYIKRVSNQAAAFGFYVVAPALFDRVERGIALTSQPDDIARGAAIAARIPPEDQVRDIAGAVAQINREKVGVLGFGWGGTSAWLAAGDLAGLHAAVAYYGTGIAQVRQHTPRCPTQLHFGAYDPFIPMRDVEAIRRAQPAVEIEVYPLAGHFFACDESEAFEPESMEESQDNMLAFLRRYL
jgi:carboxymethylenebutenolidase